MTRVGHQVSAALLYSAHDCGTIKELNNAALRLEEETNKNHLGMSTWTPEFLVVGKAPNPFFYLFWALRNRNINVTQTHDVTRCSMLLVRRRNSLEKKVPYFHVALFQLVLNSSAGGRLAGGHLGRQVAVLAAQHGIVDGRKEHSWSHVIGEKLQAVQLRQHAPCKMEEPTLASEPPQCFHWRWLSEPRSANGEWKLQLWGTMCDD